MTRFSDALLLVLLLHAAPLYAASPSREDAGHQIFPSDKAISRLAGGLQFATVSRLPYEETDFGPFAGFLEYLRESYPRIFASAEASLISDYSLVIRWHGANPEKEPLLFLSHYDVVPAAEAGEQAVDSESVFRPADPPSPRIDALQTSWTYPPFSGAAADGRIYGRGALDMKGMLFALLEAADTLLAEGFIPERGIWFAFGHDEETGGQWGARRIAETFMAEGQRFAAVFDEGGIVADAGSVLSAVQTPFALVGMGEKGFLTLRIRVRGTGGHSSMPPAKNSLVMAAEIAERLNSHQMPSRIIPPIADMLARISSEASIPLPRGTESLRLLELLEKEPAGNALVRTTTAVTMMRGSEAPNVVPSVSELTVNFRLLPGDSVEGVIAHVTALCRGYDTEIEVYGTAREASGLTPEDSPYLTAIAETAAAIFPDVTVTPYLTIGGTDAYKYQELSSHIFRFMPVRLNRFEQGTIHETNEHITIESYGKMIRYFEQFMRRAAGGEDA